MNQLPENFIPVVSPNTEDPFRNPLPGSRDMPCRRCGRSLAVSPRNQQIIQTGVSGIPGFDAEKAKLACVLLCKGCTEAVLEETGNHDLKVVLGAIIAAMRRGQGRRVNESNAN